MRADTIMDFPDTEVDDLEVQCASEYSSVKIRKCICTCWDAYEEQVTLAITPSNISFTHTCYGRKSSILRICCWNIAQRWQGQSWVCTWCLPDGPWWHYPSSYHSTWGSPIWRGSTHIVLSSLYHRLCLWKRITWWNKINRIGVPKKNIHT